MGRDLDFAGTDLQCRIYLYLGQAKALEFFTGYVIEKSLSVDNLFVFIMIFSYFHVPRLYQPKILKWDTGRSTSFSPMSWGCSSI